MKKLNFVFLISLIAASQISFAAHLGLAKLNFGAVFKSSSGENTGVGTATSAPARSDRVPLSPNSPNTSGQNSSSKKKKKSYRFQVARKKILNPKRTDERRAELAGQRIRFHGSAKTYDGFGFGGRAFNSVLFGLFDGNREARSLRAYLKRSLDGKEIPSFIRKAILKRLSLVSEKLSELQGASSVKIICDYAGVCLPYTKEYAPFFRGAETIFAQIHQELEQEENAAVKDVVEGLLGRFSSSSSSSSSSDQ